MSKCQNCTYWAPDKTAAFEKQFGLAVCDRALFLEDNIFLREDGNKYVLSEKANKVGIFAIDGSGYRAAVLTKPTFGCHEFKAKEND